MIWKVILVRLFQSNHEKSESNIHPKKKATIKITTVFTSAVFSQRTHRYGTSEQRREKTREKIIVSSVQRLIRTRTMARALALT